MIRYEIGPSGMQFAMSATVTILRLLAQKNGEVMFTVSDGTLTGSERITIIICRQRLGA